MMVGGAPFHLTYSTNVHPADRWADVRAMLDRCVLPIRRRVAPGDASASGSASPAGP
jgi:hypothetical protein